MTPRLERIATLWRHAGFRVEAVADITRLIWERLICNVAFSGPCALTGRTIGEMLADAEGWSIDGAVPAAAIGLTAPVNEVVSALVRTKERDFV